MSIIIKGLDLPPVSDTNGIINLSIDCYGQVVVSNTHPTKILKAEQIPKHERLIDAEALIREAVIHFFTTNYFNDICKMIDNSPTIIEAEEDEKL